MRPFISLAMIVRDEEANLTKCLESVKDCVDEIVIVDTGSKDNTVALARKFTDNVFAFEWQGDFSAARNYALCRCSGEWILSLDADETLDCRQGDLRRLVDGQIHVEAFFLPLYCRSIDGIEQHEQFAVIRFFRNLPYYRFTGKIHEHIIVEDSGKVGIAQSPVICHNSVERKKWHGKRQRNLLLLKTAMAEEPDNLFLQYYMGVEWVALGKFAKALPYLNRAYRELSDEHIIFKSSAARYAVECFRRLGKTDEAFAYCMEVSLKYPNYTDIFFDGGVLLETLGEYEIAARWFQAAVETGTPPAGYRHASGTETFLSYYHLGYCQESMHKLEDALRWYEAAIMANPAYIYPVYNILALLMAEVPENQALRYLAEREYYSFPGVPQAAAELLFEAGRPQLALEVLYRSGCMETDNRNMDIYKIYGGCYRDISGGLSDNWLSNKQSVHYIVACILAGDLSNAKRSALALWKKPAMRSQAWAVLGIIAKYQGLDSYSMPEKSREAEAVNTAVSILDYCLKAASACNPASASYLKAAAVAEVYLIERTREGCAKLAAYWQSKANACLGILNTRHLPARGLYDAKQ